MKPRSRGTPIGPSNEDLSRETHAVIASLVHSQTLKSTETMNIVQSSRNTR